MVLLSGMNLIKNMKNKGMTAIRIVEAKLALEIPGFFLNIRERARIATLIA
jgi:hypothetical protein